MKSSRAAVFAEFCLIAPLLVLLVSGMIEVAGYFDAQVMANHTAWTIGRQATVHMDEIADIKTDKDGIETIEDYNEHFVASSENPWKGGIFDQLGGMFAALKDMRDHGRVTVVMLMATCGMGYYGPTLQAGLGKVLKSLLVEPIKKLGENIKKLIQEKLMPSNSNPGDFNPLDVDAIKKLITTELGKLITKLINPIIEKLTSALSDKIESLLDGLDEKLGGDELWQRRFRQIYGAAMRVACDEHRQTVYTITALGTKFNPLTYNEDKYYEIRQGHDPLSFPQAFCAANDPAPAIKDYVVTGYRGWPPNGQYFPMLRIDVRWPYESMWMFPVVSGLGGARRHGDRRGVLAGLLAADDRERPSPVDRREVLPQGQGR